jgi:hypothetical protein
MRFPKYMQNVLVGAAAVAAVGSYFVVGSYQPGPVEKAAVAVVTGNVTTDSANGSLATAATAEPAPAAKTALSALSALVRPLSSPHALSDAFNAYYAYKSAHPSEVKKPYLYFVDYGLASTEKRGYVFDMNALKIVDGPFTVAHGRGSSTSQYGVPTKFSNSSRSGTTSLGLYVTKALYAFTGHMAGSTYSSIGLRLAGVSKGFNDNAYARGVVAHGAPYVTPTKAGRSQGCPAMEPARAKNLLPKLADGAMVFLFAPNQNWMANDPWVNA